MKKLYFSVIALCWAIFPSQAQELLASARNEPQPEVINPTPPPAKVSGKPSQALKPAVASESSFYVRVYGAYALAMPGAYNSLDLYNTSFPALYSGFTSTTSGATTTIQDNKGGLGQGLRFGGGIGYILNDFVNLGLDVDYYKSGTFTAVSASTTAVNSTTSTLSATMITITPNITFKAISADNYYIYNRLGINVGLPKVTEVFTVTSGGATSPAIGTYEFQGGIGLGYLVGFGIQFRASNSIRAFVEINANSISYSPQKRVQTAYTEAGVDKSATQPASVKLIEYFDNLTAGAGKSVTLTMPFNSIGLQVGLAYRF